MKRIVYLPIIIISCIACNDTSNGQVSSKQKIIHPMSDSGKIEKSDAEWKKILSEEQFNVLRNKGTEQPFTGKYYLHKDKGVYVCAGCGAELFTSDTKFESGCGWPSFNNVIDSSKVVYTKDTSFGMVRTEITCARCGGHLGHVFDDGPPPTGQRYCINSVSIEFKK